MSFCDVVVFCDDQVQRSAFPQMEDMRRSGVLCDITIKVENRLFHGHKLILAATIPYFRGMFTSDMTESRQREVAIKGIDPDAMELLINFVYGGNIAITNSNVQNLMIGASYLQLHNVKEFCGQFMMDRFHSANVLGIKSFADSMNCQPLVEAAELYIEKYFEEVALTEEFLSLSLEEIKDLLERNRLRVTSEEQVFEAMMRWVKKDTARTEFLPALLTLIRMPFLSPAYIADCVAHEQLVRSSHRCRDIVDEAKDYYLLPDRRCLVRSFAVSPRLYSNIIGLIFAVGGLAKSGDSLRTVEVFDPQDCKWYLSEDMSSLRSRVGVAVAKGLLYAIGGYNGQQRLNTVEVFDPVNGKWKKVSCMKTSRSAVGVAVLNDELYVCGGYDGVTSMNAVEIYNPEKDEWRDGPLMLRQRSAAGVVALNGAVYAVGGHDGLSIFDSVEKLEPSSGEWRLVAPMLSKRCRLGVAVLGNKLYACGGYDGHAFLQSVECYDPVLNTWALVAPMAVTRSRVGLAASLGKLWAIGGYDGANNLSTVEEYDPVKNEWNFVPPMVAHEGGVGVGVVPGPLAGRIKLQ